jgi:glucose/arabinose dehydrogenase
MATNRPRLVLALVLVAIAAAALWRAVGGLSSVVSLAGGQELTGGAAPWEEPPAAAGTGSTGEPLARVRLVPVATGLERPLFVTHAGDGSGRLFVVEQGGTIRVARGGRLLERPFLDVTRRLDNSSGERGLLGLAFAPDYRTSGFFFLVRTAPGPSVVVERYRVSPDPDRADPGSAKTVLAMDDPASNHNGGMVAFGPDGYLWLGTGDGGRAADPWDNARDPRSLLGKLLRIDVRERLYAIPPDSPFAAGGRGRPEVWALGLRNPWRFSFDRATGELWIGDVGQGAWEEIDVVDPRRGGGMHFGWKTMEGRHCFDPPRGCDPAGLELPVHEYGHELGCSVTGGYVYRGRNLPALAGAYLFSDFCRGTVWTLMRQPEGPARVATLVESGAMVSSFGEDEAGELYLCDHRGGKVLRLESGGG